ncbi:MAG TPA: hypothetical protein VFL70_09500 [Bacteroidia bacterium]|nr:hypothetical protein [Bacteroidia bacterium]
MTMDKLTYAKQFLLSPLLTNELVSWNHTIIGVYNLYSHPDLDITQLASNNKLVELILIGFVVDPHNPEYSNKDILSVLSHDVSISSIAEKLYHYAGRFVLIVKDGEKYSIFHDPCGLRSVFYTKYEEKIFAASQPLLLKKVIPLQEGARYKKFYASSYIKSDIEYYLPTGCSLFEGVYQLTPNHYFDFNSFSSIRYWPTAMLKRQDIHEAVEKMGILLRKIILAYHKRFKLALPITAGYDSRVVLSACKPIAGDIFFYTLQYRDLKEDSTDIKVPKKLLTKLGYQHHIINCNKAIDPAFAEIYKNNSDISHLNDWGYIAYGMKGQIPHDRVVIKGNCAEIARCAYYMSGKKENIQNASQILSMEPGWNQHEFIVESISNWLKDIKKIENNFGYDVVDMFYWEQRLGNWQAQSQLEWDIVQEAITPFNHRELLDIGLGVDNKYKCKPHFYLFPMIAEYLWKETLSEPINPRPFYHKFKVLMEIIVKQLTVRR